MITKQEVDEVYEGPDDGGLSPELASKWHPKTKPTKADFRELQSAVKFALMDAQCLQDTLVKMSQKFSPLLQGSTDSMLCTGEASALKSHLFAWKEDLGKQLLKMDTKKEVSDRPAPSL